MTIDLNVKITTLDDTVLTDKDGKEFTVRNVFINALLSNDERADGKTKMERWLLAKRAHEEAALDVTPEQVVDLKKLIGQQYSPLVVGQVWPLLDGKA